MPCLLNILEFINVLFTTLNLFKSLMSSLDNFLAILVLCEVNVNGEQEGEEKGEGDEDEEEQELNFDISRSLLLWWPCV